MSTLIDIPFPEDCNHCLICSLIPEPPKRELREKGLQYRLYCKVTGKCVSEVGRGEDCPLHKCKTGKWIRHPEVKNIYGGTYIECSECRTRYVVTNVEEELFCRNCGSFNAEGAEQE